MAQRSSPPPKRSPWERTWATTGRSIPGVVLTLLLFFSTCKAQTPPGWTVSQSGQNSIYRPGNLPAGRYFTLTVEPPQTPQGQPLLQWFDQHAGGDLAQRGTTLSLGTPQYDSSGVLHMLSTCRDSSGRQWMVMYSAVPLAGGSVQFSSILSNLSTSETSRYIKEGAAMLGQMARAANANSPQSAQSNVPESNNASNASPAYTPPPPANPAPSNPAPSREDQSNRSIRTAQPGSGMQPAQIAAILHEGRGVSTASGYQYEESADLLLKDGWEYSGLKVPPEDLNVAASKQLQPGQWHRWRSQGQDIYIQDQRSGQWSKLEADHVIPLRSTMEQHLISRHSTGFGGMGSFNTRNDITFHADGSFERSSSVLAGSGVVQVGGGFSGGAASYHDRYGCGSTASGTSSAGGSTVGAYSTSHCKPGQDANSYGTYRISGYTLELDSASGQVQRVLAFYPFANKPQIYIDSMTFSVFDGN